MLLAPPPAPPVSDESPFAMLSAAVVALLLPAHVMRCDLATRMHRPTACVRRALRASPLRLELDGGGGELGDELEAALRKALSEMPAQEQIDSDRRLLDGLVDEAQANDMSASMSALDRELASVQDAMESKIDSKLRDLEGETMAKIDAAVEELRKGRAKLNAKEGSWEAADAAAAAELAAGALDAGLPSGALVVVVGGGTALGRELLSVLGQGEAPFALRSLELGAPPAPPPGKVAA